METITLTLCDNRLGSASSYLGGLTLETYQFKGRDIPDGTRVALLTPDGRTLAAATVQGGAAEVDTDTQEVADLLRYLPVGAEAQIHIAIGDEDNILAIIPAKMRKNWLDDSAVRPPAPLPDYWTSAQTRDAIAEALKGYSTEEWVNKQLAKKQNALEAGDNITLEQQDNGKVRISSNGGGLPNSVLVSSGDPATVDAEAKKYAVIGAGATGYRCSVVVGDGGFANEGGVALGEDASAGYDGVGLGRGAIAHNFGVSIGHAARAFDSGLAAGDTASAGRYAVALGVSACAEEGCSVALGAYATTSIYSEGVAVGPSAYAAGHGGVAIGTYARAFKNSVALGYRASGGLGWNEGKGIAIGYYSESKGRNLAIGVGAAALSLSYGNLALGSCAYVGYDADFENAAIGYGAVVDGVCTYRAAVLGAQGYTNISGGTVLSASDREQTLTLQLYLVACRKLCKYGVIGLTMTDWLTGETSGVYTGADVFMAALNGTPWTGAFGGCCSCAA